MIGSSLLQTAEILGLKCENIAKITHFAIDSRHVVRGGLFFALPGEKVDGHQYLEAASAKGAFGAVVSKKYKGHDFGLELLRVDDVREALQQLAKVAFASRREKVIAITGSMGKTTTKEFLATLLSAKYRVAKTPKNYNTQLTLPLTLLNLEGEYDVLVLEMGMSEKEQIAKLVEIAPPDLAVVTRIAPAGIPGGSLSEIAAAKSEIFSQPRTQLGIISAQAASFKEVLYGGSIPKLIYGWKEDFTDFRMGDFVMEKTPAGLVIEDSPPITLSIEGDHLKENFLAAVAIARTMGLSWSDIQEKARELKPFDLRFQRVEKGGITFIQDCYNANPDSVCAALKNLPKPEKGGSVIGVLGAMADLGKHSAHYHTQVGMVAKEHLDHVLCIGKEAKGLSTAFSKDGKPSEHFEHLDAIKKRLDVLLKPGDVVLIKGSNALNLWNLLED